VRANTYHHDQTRQDIHVELADNLLDFDGVELHVIWVAGLSFVVRVVGEVDSICEPFMVEAFVDIVLGDHDCLER
jgi:hypothetical protein